MRRRELLDELMKVNEEKARKLRLPGKQMKLLQKMNKAVLDKRTQELSEFLANVVGDEELRESECCQRFLKESFVSVSVSVDRM